MGTPNPEVLARNIQRMQAELDARVRAFAVLKRQEADANAALAERLAPLEAAVAPLREAAARAKLQREIADGELRTLGLDLYLLDGSTKHVAPGVNIISKRGTRYDAAKAEAWAIAKGLFMSKPAFDEKQFTKFLAGGPVVDGLEYEITTSPACTIASDIEEIVAKLPPMVPTVLDIPVFDTTPAEAPDVAPF